MRIFTMGELFAGSNGMKCEHKSGCDNRTYEIYLTDSENMWLPEQSGNIAAEHIIRNQLGVALCEKHMIEQVESEA